MSITFYTVPVALLKTVSGNEKVELYTTWTTTMFAGIQNEQHILVRSLTKYALWEGAQEIWSWNMCVKYGHEEFTKN